MHVNDIERLTREQLLKLEPNLSTRALGGLLIRGEATIDSWLLPVSLAHTALRNGAHVSNFYISLQLYICDCWRLELRTIYCILKTAIYVA